MNAQTSELSRVPSRGEASLPKAMSQSANPILGAAAPNLERKET